MSKWRVGEYLDPKQDDPEFTDEYIAINAASEMVYEKDYTAIAVWDEHCDPVHLFYGGEHFRRA